MRYSQSQFEVTHYLGNQIGRKNRYLKNLACMSKEYRLIRGYLECIEEIIKAAGIKPDKEERKTLDLIKSIIERIGESDFQMDIVSHLSMRIGDAYKSYEGE